MERTNKNNNAARQTGNVHNDKQQAHLKDILLVCLANWKWFLLSLAVVVGGAYLVIKTIPPTYTRTASILISSEDKSNGAKDVLDGLGIQPVSVNMNNEIDRISSINVISEVIRRLGLDVEYLHDGVFHDEVVYGVNLPVRVKFDGLNDNETASLRLELKKDGTVIVSDIERNDQPVDGSFSLALGKTVKINGLGKLTVSPSPEYRKGLNDDLRVVRSTSLETMNSVKERLSPMLRNKNSTILDIDFTDVSTDRAEDFLSTLISVYNENWVKDRNQQTVSTNDFIRERLGVIEQELGNVEQNISEYKSAHLMTDAGEVGGMAMAQVSEADQQSRTLDNQAYMARYIRGYLTDGRHTNQLIPSNSGIENQNIESQINEYNSIMLQRNKHLANSSAQNPLVMDLEQNMSILRRSIIQSLDNELTMLNQHKRTASSSRSQAVAKIAQNPKQAKYLLSVERQQKVKESLYLFLLQKREENELSQAFTAYNTQLLDPPHGSMEPTSPQSRNILIVAFVIGLALPASVIFMREFMNTTVHGRKDLEDLTVPFVGEIPLAESEEKRHLTIGKKQHHHHVQPKVLIEEENRNMINEAFRVVRTNLEFMAGFDNSHKVIMLTSINVNSGKTFISANLSTALAINGKKVLVIDLDLRKGSLSRYVGKPHRGVSNYLNGQEGNLEPLIVKCGKVDVLPCGTIPPNPAELLSVPRFSVLIEEARKRYDYVFLDCPPVEIVADSFIINRHVDLTLFVVRAQMLDRSFLPEIEHWYEEKKYKNLALLLNGTTDMSRHYGYHRYGYSYGYNYGYRYGYGEENGKK